MIGRGPRALLFCVALSSATAAGAEAAAEEKAPATQTLGGFDLDLALTDTSGVTFQAEAYENLLSVGFDPKFHLGRRLFEGGWAEPLVITGSFSIDGELSGNDPGYRGTSFGSPALLRESPELVQFAQATRDGALTPDDAVDGADRRTVVSDLRLGASHDEVWTVPVLELEVAAAVRLVLPLSSASRNTGLRAAPSLGVGVHRALGPIELRWDVRGTWYLVSSTTAPVGGPGGTVRVNGQDIEPYRPATTGTLNPSHALVNTLQAAVELPRNFSLSAEYSLVNQWLQPLGGCGVDGVPTADLCRDGPALGTVQGLGQRDTQSFWIEAGWKANAWGSVGLGLSTARPVRTEGGAIANPFLWVDRNNYSSLYLSLYVNAEALASTLHPAPAASK